jgi:hypothetical protein
MPVIVVGGQQSISYIEPDSGIHGHEVEDIIDEGKLDITEAEIDTLTIKDGVQLISDAALAFTPYNNAGQQVAGAIYQFGRQENIGDQTPGLLDGLTMKREINNKDQELNIQLHPSAPCIDINCTKNAGVDYIRMTDSDTLATILAVHDDGTIETPGWSSGPLPDGYLGALAVPGNSIYIGSSRLSEKNGVFHCSHLKAPPHIPLRLTQTPYSLTTGNINANTPRNINDWVILARSVVTAVQGKAIRIKDIFPVANDASDWVDSGLLHAHTLTSDVQAQLNAMPAPQVTEQIYVDSSFSGTSTGSVIAPYSSLSTASLQNL